MTTTIPSNERHFTVALENFLETNGVWPLLRATLKALQKRRQHRRMNLHELELSNHLRRDVGLAPLERPPDFTRII